MKPSDHSGDPDYFYLVREAEVKTDGNVIWRSEVRQGIYRGKYKYQYFTDKSALERELKTKELDGYILVSETNYSSALDNDWLIEMGLRWPQHK
jgi:hypothetical protein